MKKDGYIRLHKNKIKLYITKYMGKIERQMENCKNEFVI